MPPPPPKGFGLAAGAGSALSNRTHKDKIYTLAYKMTESKKKSNSTNLQEQASALLPLAFVVFPKWFLRILGYRSRTKPQMKERYNQPYRSNIIHPEQLTYSTIISLILKPSIRQITHISINFTPASCHCNKSKGF